LRLAQLNHSGKRSRIPPSTLAIRAIDLGVGGAAITEQTSVLPQRKSAQQITACTPTPKALAEAGAERSFVE